MLFPFLLQFFYSKTLEQFLSSFEIGFEGGQEQTLSEPSGAAHEVRFADVGDAHISAVLSTYKYPCVRMSANVCIPMGSLRPNVIILFLL